MLKDKSVVVTGGSRGIGFACAAEALRAGASVTLCARGGGELRAAHDLLAGEFGADRVASVVTDVAREADVERLCETAVAAFGGLDAVMHAAAVCRRSARCSRSMPMRGAPTWRSTSSAPSRSSPRGATHARTGRTYRRLFRRRGFGPVSQYTAYACSKVAVVRFVETVAQELRAEGIEINALAPGFVATRMHQETLRPEPRGRCGLFGAHQG